MRAAYCTAAGVLEVRQVADPTPERGQVIVQVRSCGICGSDLHYYAGGEKPPRACPGHEIAGEIVAVGRDTAARVGAHVAVEPLVTCGQCSACRTGDYQLCVRLRIIGHSVDGGFADFVRAPASATFELPENVDVEVGALTEPLAVAVHALRLLMPTPGDRHLILGSGTIGLMSVAAAAAAGAGEIWITARHPQQEAAALRLGATRVFRGAQAEAELREAAQAQPIDAVIETVGGTANTLEQAIHLVRAGGSVAVLGIFSESPRLDALLLVVREVRLIGSMTYGRSGARADFDRALAILARDPERFRALITHRVGLAEIGSGFAQAADKRSGAIKVAVSPGLAAG